MHIPEALIFAVIPICIPRDWEDSRYAKAVIQVFLECLLSLVPRGNITGLILMNWQVKS